MENEISRVVSLAPIPQPAGTDGKGFDLWGEMSDGWLLIACGAALGFWRGWETSHDYASDRALGILGIDPDRVCAPMTLDAWTIWTPTLLLARLIGNPEITAGAIGTPMLSRLAYWAGGRLAAEMRYWLLAYRVRQEEKAEAEA